MWCCNCGHEEEEKSTIHNHTTGRVASKPEEFTSLLNSAHAHQLSDVTVMSPSEKMKEKARLQELVKGFAKRAVHGVACQIVDVATGRINPAAYEIDRQLRRLRVVPKDPDVPIRAHNISRIRDSFSIEAGEASVPPAVRSALVEEQQRRLVLISFEDAPMLCLLEASIAERERFVTCLKILRLFAAHAVSSEPGRATASSEATPMPRT